MSSIRAIRAIRGHTFFKPFVCVLLMAVIGSGCGSTHLLTVEDRICPRGEKIKLVGKLEYRGLAVFNKGLDERKLSFHLDGRLIGRDETNEEGYAHVKHRFKRPGRHRLRVTYDDQGRRPTQTSANVFVWPDDDPILIVDIDDTVVQTRKRHLILPGPDVSEPMPGARDVLRKLSARFRIVYLTARPRELIAKTHEWLARNSFPPGPVLTWDVDKDPWSQADYKKHRIDDLQDDFEHVTIGIGNTAQDHYAYRKRKLFSIILKGGQPPATIKRGVQLPNWPAIRNLFARNAHLYDKNFSSKASVILP